MSNLEQSLNDIRRKHESGEYYKIGEKIDSKTPAILLCVFICLMSFLFFFPFYDMEINNIKYLILLFIETGADALPLSASNFVDFVKF